MSIQIEPVADLYGELQEQPFISVVIPCRDDAETVGRAVVHLADAFHSRGYPFEVLVADAGSRDATGRLVDELSRRAKRSIGEIRFLGKQGLAGLGSAAAAGLAAARGNYCLVAHAAARNGDANAIQAMEQFDAMVRALDQGDHVAVGSHGIMLRREVVRALADKVLVSGPGFYLELVHLARRIGFKIRFFDERGPRVGSFRELLTPLFVKLQDLAGAYDLANAPRPRAPRESTRMAVARS